MKRSKQLALIYQIVVVFGCQAAPVPPARPPGVPAGAVWAGGPDGGNWFLCVAGAELLSYVCSVYWDSDGSLQAHGPYALRRATRVAGQEVITYHSVERQPAELEFDFFDGVLIHLGADLALVPDGEIDFPFGDGHGKKQRYEAGRAEGPEQEY